MELEEAWEGLDIRDGLIIFSCTAMTGELKDGWRTCLFGYQLYQGGLSRECLINVVVRMGSGY